MHRGKHVPFLLNFLLFTFHITPNPDNWTFNPSSLRVLRKELHDNAALVQSRTAPLLTVNVFCGCCLGLGTRINVLHPLNSEKVVVVEADANFENYIDDGNELSLSQPIG